jgi:hypothetical protein
MSELTNVKKVFWIKKLNNRLNKYYQYLGISRRFADLFVNHRSHNQFIPFVEKRAEIAGAAWIGKAKPNNL